MPTRILFVCLGNICRSPLADGVFQDRLDSGRLDGDYTVDSAGTGAWHVGEKPDSRMRATASHYGVSLESLRARKFIADDFDRFDLILAMDRKNQQDILSLARSDADRQKVRLFRSYDPEPEDGNVPDPYYGGEDGFHNVFRIVDRTVDALIEDLNSQ